MSQDALFQMPTCERCQGKRRVIDHDLGWHVDCPACGGTGVQGHSNDEKEKQ